ncbi:MAG: XrtA/PEP-CTERM system histidine kinase PrsK [Pseudomonadota bacterium]
MSSLINVSSSLSALLYLLIAVSYAIGRKPGSTTFIPVLLVSAIWSTVSGLHPVFDFFHVAFWSTTFLIVIGQQRRLVLWSAPVAAALGALISVTPGSGVGVYYLYLYACVGTLLLLEQFIRYNPGRLRALGIGMGALFLFNLYIYASGLMDGEITFQLLQSRELANLSVALLLVAAPFFMGSEERPRKLGLSRGTVFTTTSLVLAGFVLLAVATLGYLMRLGGGQYSFILQHFVPFLGALCVGLYLASSQRRARIRVWIDKILFRTKYDYNIEWRNLSERLAIGEDRREYGEAALNAILPILNATGGALFLRDDSGLVPRDRINLAVNLLPVTPEAEGFFRQLESNWIFVLTPLAEKLARHNELIPESLKQIPDARLILPLTNNNVLVGFVLICGPASITEDFDWEDLDLFRMVSRQVASFVGYQALYEEMVVKRQFEAFHQFTTFVMHDLKNLIAQQALVVQNASRFIDKPEFVADAIDTIDSSVKRMERMIRKLSQNTYIDQPGGELKRVSLTAAATTAVERAQVKKPLPTLVGGDQVLGVKADFDALVMALSHLISNGQDACEGRDGSVEVRLAADGDSAVCEIIDTGEGMDEAFIRDRLFKPFDSTKSTKGMGVGAYQCRQIILRFGGQLTVNSEPGVGSRFIVRLPLADEGGN